MRRGPRATASKHEANFKIVSGGNKAREIPAPKNCSLAVL